MSKSLTIMVALAAVALIAAGCGGSDKPSYCSDVSDLRKSVDDLKNIQLSGSDSVSTLQTQLEEVQGDANAVVSSAKKDFPSETSALKSSVSGLSSAIEQLPASATAEQLAPLAPMVRSVVTASKDLDTATTSACE
jgi:hypothetical protein